MDPVCICVTSGRKGSFLPADVTLFLTFNKLQKYTIFSIWPRKYRLYFPVKLQLFRNKAVGFFLGRMVGMLNSPL